MIGMRAALSFTITTGWIQTGFEQLSALGTYRRQGGQTVWTFKISDIAKVISILGKPIEFDKESVEEVIKRSPPTLKERIELLKSKGKGRTDITETPVTYEVVQVINKTPTRFSIPKENVETVWGVVSGQPIGTPVKTATVAKNVCAALGITRFNRLSGSFQFDKFFGSRQDYFKLFYYPIKVLQAYGVVHHAKDGHVVRLAELWDRNTRALDIFSEWSEEDEIINQLE